MIGSRGSLLGPAIAGGLLAALGVGTVESLLVVARHGMEDPGVFLFAWIAYGLFGLAGGLGLGIAFVLFARRILGAASAAAISAATVMTLLGTVIGRFLVFRDLLDEKLGGHVMAFQLGTVAGALLLFGGTYFACKIWAKRPRAIITSLPKALGVSALAIAVAALATTVAGGRGSPQRQGEAAAARAQGPNVVLILIDTLRADHLSCYGYQKISTPAIDTLATDGTRFEYAFAQASWTRPSIATVLTSLYPSSHQAMHKADALPSEVITLAEVMQGSGYYTAGFVDNVNIAPVFNFDQGFDEYYFLAPEFFFHATHSASELAIYNQLRLIRERFISKAKYVEHYYQPAQVVTDRALAWLDEGRPEPFFLFVHYMDPHDPYFAHPFNGEGYARVADPNPPKERAELYRRLYDGEIEYLDGELGRLLDGLKGRGLYSDAIIALTADHGEEFFDHGGWWHGETLYEEQIRVPLVVKGAGTSGSGSVNQDLATSLDIAPTLITLAGAKVPTEMQGRVLPLASGDPDPRDAVFSEEDFEGNVLTAVRTQSWKRIMANAGNPRGLPMGELFNIGEDPGEQHNLAKSRPEVMDQLAARANLFKKEAQKVAVQSAGAEVDKATEERLRALGYVN